MKSLFKVTVFAVICLLASCQNKVDFLSQEKPLTQKELVDKLSHDSEFVQLIDEMQYDLQDTIKESLDHASQQQFEDLRTLVKAEQFTDAKCMRIVKDLSIDKAVDYKVVVFKERALTICNKYKSSFDFMDEKQKRNVLDEVFASMNKNFRKRSVCDDCGGDVERGIWTELATGILCVLSGWDPSCDAASDGFLTIGLSIGVCIYCCSPGVNCR